MSRSGAALDRCDILTGAMLIERPVASVVLGVYGGPQLSGGAIMTIPMSIQWRKAVRPGQEWTFCDI